MTKFIEKAGIWILLSLCLSMSFGCTDYSPDLDEVEKRLDGIEDNRIASIDKQIESINASLPRLEKADADLKRMIENLQTTASGLEKSIAENGKNISDLKTDLEKAVEDLKNSDRADKEYVLDSLGKAKAVLLALLESEKTEMDGKLASINNTISDLQKKDAELEKKISDLKDYTDKELKVTKDWLSATFMTLDQYNAIVEQLGGINGEIAGLKTSMTNLETRLTEKYSKDLKAAADGVKSKLAGEVDGLNDRIDKVVSDITKAYTDAIATFREEMEKWWNESLKKSIDDCETSMKSWVNSTLDGYWTIAQTKDSLKALNDDIENQLEAQKTFLNGLIEANAADIKALNDKLKELDEAVKKNSDDIDAVGKALGEAKNELTEAYTDAISKAISEFEGTFSDEIKSRIVSVNNSLETKNKAIESKVLALEESVNSLKDKLSEFLNASVSLRIQSVEWFPLSKDGKEILYYDKGDPEFPGSENYRYITFRFEVSPASEASGITKSLLSARLLYTKTRAAAGDVEELDITDFKNEFGSITVTIDAGKVSKDFIDGKIPASVAVAVGNVSTKYVPLKAQALEDPVIRYTTTDGKMLPDSEIVGVRGFSKDGGILNRKHIYGRIDFTGAEIGELLLNLSRKSYEEDPNATLMKIKVCRNVAVAESGIYIELKFRNQYKLEFADLEKLDVSKVDNFMEMFAWCTRLKDLRISSWKPKPKDMYQAFYRCSNLETLNLSGWDMSQIERVTELLYNCASLKELYLDNWNLNNYTGGSYPYPQVYEGNVFSGINCRRRDFNIYVRNCNKKTVEAVKRWVNNSVIAQGEPLKDGRCNIVTK